ncbi:hypothetical protein FRC02_007182, partial [Tulasnella sp. 418]
VSLCYLAVEILTIIGILYQLGITEFLDTLIRGLQVEEQAPEVVIVIDTEPSLNLQKWLCTTEDLETRTYAPIMIAFKSEEKA